MDRYVAYIEEMLHMRADISQYACADDLPLYLRGAFELYTLVLQDVRCLLARPKDAENLTVLRKQSGHLKKLTGLNCVLCLEGVRLYTKEKMVAEGIPFVILGQQLYMPFLGVVLTRSGMRELPDIDNISFSTQKTLLTAFYQGWTQTTLTEAARTLGVSKMTMTRIFDELEAIGLPLIKADGKTRRFMWNSGRRALWNTVYPVLRNPVTCQFRYGRRLAIEAAKLGGMSAISHYSMLADSPCTVYAVSKADAKTLSLLKLPLIPEGEEPDMIVQIIPYRIAYGDGMAVDPLTAIMSLTDIDKKDPRVDSAIEEILEVCLND